MPEKQIANIYLSSFTFCLNGPSSTAKGLRDIWAVFFQLSLCRNVKARTPCISSANGNTTKQSTTFYYKVIPVYKLACKATDTTILLQKKVNKGNDSEMHKIIPLHRSNLIGINASSGDWLNTLRMRLRTIWESSCHYIMGEHYRRWWERHLKKGFSPPRNT